MLDILKAVVYGMDLPEAQLEHVANLNIPQTCMLKDLTVNAIIDRTMAVTGGARDGGQRLERCGRVGATDC